MDLEAVKKRLAERPYKVSDESRLSNETGTQLRLENQAIINVFDTGKVSYQGKNPEPVKAWLESSESSSSSNPEYSNNDVFVVYGHDLAARAQLEALLRRWNLNPLFLDQLPSEGQTIIEKLEKYTGQVQYAIVLATPDDEGHKSGRPDEKAFRARQNVVLELGMVLWLLGRKRVAILLKNPNDMEKPSDIEGLLYIPFTDNLEKEAGVTLAKEMSKAGYSITVDSL